MIEIMAANLFQLPDGVFKAKFNTDSDHWSVILPYIDGQKYTIGDTCISRETQGEFVYLKPEVWTKRSANPWNWSFGLEIFCKNWHYWVKAVEGDGIFQNGVKLDDKVKTKLNFGDVFTVTKFRNDISGGLAIFTFEKREYPENWDRNKKICTSENPAELNVAFQNDLIFFKILSLLSVGSLKNARLVCRHWNNQVSPILRKKCVINLNLNIWGWPFSDFNPSLKLLQYVQDMRNVTDWPNLKIIFPNLPGKWNGPANMQTC
ncbi:uncharacterized protein LOC118436881 [Folsomia candida]|uniref:uncharacterized protein LOC118436881 n=1 Tax=Folsomia candida TaxID=158441 RepID=UPI0016051044|nr:uncharacterized protein LOC118436881 [Folsomia candida]XP_035711431.1 uncharacterized protein LOC118436881 [Folsomia candida]